MDAAVAALIGAAIGSTIGAAGVIGAAWLQQRHQSRRELTKTAADLAIVDFQMMREVVKQRGGPMPPISLYVDYHAAMLRAIASDRLTPKRVKAIDERQKELIQAVHEVRGG